MQEHDEHERSRPAGATERVSDDESNGSAGVRVVEVLSTRSAWTGAPYQGYPADAPLLTVVRFSVPPNSSLPWHEHVVPNAAFVIEGAFTVEDRASQATHTVHAGEAFGESVGAVHRGYTGAEGAEIVVVYAGAEGLPLSVPMA